MIPVYIISRNDAPERLVALWADAERLGISIVRVGTDGSESSHRAHAKAWKKIAEGDAPFAVILDDDVRFDERLVSLLDRDFLARALPPRSIVVLDRMEDREPAELDMAIIKPRSLRSRGQAYIASRVAVRQLLSLPPTDEPLQRVFARQNEHGISVLAVMPSPVTIMVDDSVGEPEAQTSFVSVTIETVRRWFGTKTTFEPIPVPAPSVEAHAKAEPANVV